MTNTMLDKLHRKVPTLSFEFFPPKTPDGWSTLFHTLENLAAMHLDLVSVTYGAGGSTREKTIFLVGRIQHELGIPTMAHLTCVGHSRDELHHLLEQIHAEGVGAIMALRGDPPRGQAEFKPHADGFSYGSDLVRFIHDHSFDFTIGCACYPEKHLESGSLEDDIRHLKLKQDNGADFAVTQLFFNNDDFYAFREKAEAAGVTIPIIAGIMPVTNLKQLARFQEMCGCSIPKKLTDFLGSDDDPDETVRRGIDYGIRQCDDLLQNSVAGIHLYTLNKSISSRGIVDALRIRGHFPIPESTP